MSKPTLLITGFNTKSEVKAFIQWYEGQGEQDAAVWFECRQADGQIPSSFMATDCKETYPVKFDENKQAKLVLKMVE